MDTHVEVRDDQGGLVTEGEGQVFIGDILTLTHSHTHIGMDLSYTHTHTHYHLYRWRGESVSSGPGRDGCSRDNESHWRLGECQK